MNADGRWLKLLELQQTFLAEAAASPPED